MTIRKISNETAKWWTDFIRKEAEEEKADEFEVKLSNYIEDTLKKDGNVLIECTFFPCDELIELAKKCEVENGLINIPPNSFWKISIIGDTITVTTKASYECNPFTTYDKLT